MINDPGVISQIGPLVLIAPLIVAGMVWDARYRKLPNTLTVSLAVVGLTGNLAFGGSSALISAACGLLIGFGLLLPVYLFGMVGAGDLKFLAAIGAGITARWILYATAAGVLLAGVGSLVIIMRQKPHERAGRWALISTKLSSMMMLDTRFAPYDLLAKTQKAVPYGVYLGVAALGTGLYAILVSIRGLS